MTFHPPAVFCDRATTAKLNLIHATLSRFPSGLPAAVLKHHAPQVQPDELLPLLEGLERQQRARRDFQGSYPTIWYAIAPTPQETQP